MVHSCLPSFPQLPQLSYLFYRSPAHRLPSTSKPQPCDLTAVPYTSWRPPTCPQKCGGICPHLPVGSETLVNGQLVSAPVAKKVLSSIAKKTKPREDIDLVIKAAAKDEGKVSVSGANGSGAGLLVVAVPASPAVKMVDGEQTPDLTSLFSDDDFEPGNRIPEVSTKKHHSNVHQLTADWLATLPSLPDPVPDSDDDASILALYDIGLDDDEEQDARFENNNLHPFAPPLRTLDADKDDVSVYDVDLCEDDDDKLDTNSAGCVHLPPLAVPAGVRANMRKEKIDIWCEIAASPNVVKDVAKSLEASIETEEAGGKKERPLSHIFFFEN